MNSKDIIKRVIEFNSPQRIGLNFNSPKLSDIASAGAVNYRCTAKEKEYSKWGNYEELQNKVPHFNGEVRLDTYGNIYGRLHGKTKGECVKGALEDSWDLLESFQMPEILENGYEPIIQWTKNNEDKFLISHVTSIFSTVRDLRRMENLLMDIMLEEENVAELLKKVTDHAISAVRKSAEMGFDGVMMGDDWGTQNALLINPKHWRKLFKPCYEKVVKAAHENNMKFFLHSCGYVYEIIQDLIEIGVDVLQFDQPTLVGTEKMSQEFGGKVTFWCPVDIQKILQTGNKEQIEMEARNMIKCFGRYDGGFIAKDYPTLDDINVKDEWAQWARDIFINEGLY